jgi:7-cyano-7-deazaguanine synthase
MDALAILISGGLDSAILLGNALGRYSRVHPLYIRCGLYWEQAELAGLRKFLAALQPTPSPLTILDQPAGDLYGAHWSITGQGVPDHTTPDAAVFLPGRNLLLVSKALLWCHLHQVPALALGSLGTNPFADATPEFFERLAGLVNDSMAGKVALELPFAGMKKPAVMKLGQGLPLQFSFSCIKPVHGRHCGKCNKCAERRHAFADAGMADPTEYADPVGSSGT